MTEDKSVAEESIPADLADHMPQTKNERALILKTAKFVKDGGGQIEVLLKVQQAENPKFGFLFDGHEYHPFYKWVVESPGEPVLNRSILESTSQESERKEESVPPDGIQQIMTTLISYIKRLGIEFEELVQQRCTKVAQFGFLFEGHPYHLFYKQLLEGAVQTIGHDSEEKKANPGRRKRRFHSPPPDPETSQPPEKDPKQERKLRIQQILKQKQKKLLIHYDEIVSSKSDTVTLEAHRKAFEQQDL